jgi:hypothetical protein
MLRIDCGSRGRRGFHTDRRRDCRLTEPSDVAGSVYPSPPGSDEDSEQGWQAKAGQIPELPPLPGPAWKADGVTLVECNWYLDT